MNNVGFEIVVSGVNIRPPLGAFGFSSCVLLHDNETAIMFDTGSFGIREKIKDMISHNQISALVLSHLHFDHCANIDLFQNIPIYVSEDEISSLFKSDDINVYTPLKYFFKNLCFKYLDGRTQITDNIIAYPTPGHTKGHYSLGFMNNNRNAIAAGDAIKTIKEYKMGTSVVKPTDTQAYENSRQFIINNFQIIIPGHQNVFDAQNLIEQKITLSYF